MQTYIPNIVPQFDLDAPIIPSQSAAGVNLGEDIAKILMWAKPRRIKHLIGAKRYDFGPVVLWSNSDGEVEQIGLFQGYLGKIFNKIGIGSPVKKVVSAFGAIEKNAEGKLISLESPGWCFGAGPKALRKNRLPDLAARINEIYVFNEP